MYSERVDELISSQMAEWELARVNYEQLRLVRTRNISFGDFGITIQFNPERMRSSAANVDARSIEARPCFLCGKNRPDVQRGVDFGEDMTILLNPFPIFNRHLTIPLVTHTPQLILPNFISMLRLAESIRGFTIFYNGPECGASAPDHFHFQAGNRGFMPIENDFRERRFTELIYSGDDIRLFRWRSYLRNILTIQGGRPELIAEYFSRFHHSFSLLQNEKPEPMLNILACCDDDGWVVHVIPRKLHRPAQYFLEGERRILLSPASVDLGGVIITPREEDYEKIGRSDIEDIFAQVCLGEYELQSIIKLII